MSWINSSSTYSSSAPNIADKFSKTTGSGGNGKLTYPVGLITADEIAFAGGKYRTNASNTYYYLNNIRGSVTGSKYWWTMSPYIFQGSASVYVVNGINNNDENGGLSGNLEVINSYAVRPVISLKPSVMVSGGNGTASNPYTVEAG